MFKQLLAVGLVLIGITPKLYAAPPVSSSQGMVVTEQYLASQIGANVLKAGGNAVDAAVAVGFALAVVNPCCGNLGGGGFMTLHLADGKNIFINFREKAPLAATPNMFLDAKGNPQPAKSIYGYTSVAVPGTVLGLTTALKKYGTMPLAALMQPAIKLAKEGFVLTSGDIEQLDRFAPDFKKQANVAAIFLKNNQPMQVGDKLVQTDLAETLQLIATDGAKVFYEGPIAAAIVKASAAKGGILSLKDFTSYTVQELKPITCHYHSYEIVSAPPPSSGGTTMCEMLNILEGYPLQKMGYHTLQSTHYIVEAMRFAFYDRNSKLGDPDFVNNPVAELTAKNYAAKIRAKISPTKLSSIIPAKIMHAEGMHTTHYSVLDKNGNAVAVTYTLNNLFGAALIAGDTGFLLNDTMDDFTSKPGSPNFFGLVQGVENRIDPGKRPLSAMTPTVVLYKGKPILILGSPGGPRIITATMLTLINIFDFGLNVQQAVDAPRFHQQWLPEAVDVEPNVFAPATTLALSNMGYTFTPVEKWGAVEAIYIDPLTHKIYGGSDRRRQAGRAIGY